MSRGAATAVEDLSGTWLGSFQLLRLLGAGAMGAVYLAHDEVLRRDVALKLIAKGEADTDPERQERFLREARAAARLVHPNVVQIFQVGEDEQHRFIAMEYVEGMTTARAAKQHGGRLPEQLAIEKMREAADALKLADALGICHRDIKPANLLLTGAGALKIADFGLASQVDGGESIGAGSGSQMEGTPYYMSPEQWTNGHVTPRADVYGLGCTFYHLIVGMTPYGARDLIGCFRAHTLSPVPDPLAFLPTLDPQLADLLRRCMAKRAPERPSAADVVENLDDLLAHRRAAGRARSPRAAQPAASPAAPRAREPREAERPVAHYNAGPDASTVAVDRGPAGTMTSAVGRAAGTATREAISEIRHGALGSQSYHELFALTGYPFSDIRQPTSFWDAGPFAAAVRALSAPVLAGQRPAMLLGAPGSGRTFVSEMIRARQPRILTFQIEPQLLFGARPLVSLCRQLGVSTLSPGADQRSLVEAFLLHAVPRGKADAVAVIVIEHLDPADRDLLQELGDILQSAPRGRLSMILVGPEDLPARLAEARAPEALLSGPPPVVVGAMSLPEMVDYIDFRMKTIGGSARGLELDLATQQLLHARSGGNPKLVNVFCHNAMTIAALKQEARVSLASLRVGMKSKGYLSPEAARALLG